MRERQIVGGRQLVDDRNKKVRKSMQYDSFYFLYSVEGKGPGPVLRESIEEVEWMD